MLKPKPDELRQLWRDWAHREQISDMMRENVQKFEKQHFKDLYEKEFEKVANVKFPDRVRKPERVYILRQINVCLTMINSTLTSSIVSIMRWDGSGITN